MQMGDDWPRDRDYPVYSDDEDSSGRDEHEGPTGDHTRAPAPGGSDGRDPLPLIIVGGLLVVALAIVGFFGWRFFSGAFSTPNISLPGIDLPFGSADEESDETAGPPTESESATRDSSDESDPTATGEPTEPTPTDTGTPTPQQPDPTNSTPATPAPPSPTSSEASGESIQVVLEISSEQPATVTWGEAGGPRQEQDVTGEWRQEITLAAEGGYISLFAVGLNAEDDFDLSCRLSADGQTVTEDTDTARIPSVMCGEGVYP